MHHQPESDSGHARKPWLAVLLSVAATGLGHIYCGRLVKGVTLFFVSFAFAPIMVGAAQHAAATTMLVFMIVSLIGMFAVFVYAAIDAGLLARRTHSHYSLKDYNRWYLYLIMIVVAAAYPTNMAQTIRNHVLQAFKVASASMAPGLLRGDRVFLNKAIYTTRAPCRGDAVIFVYPNDRRLFYLKRIVALPGDSVEIKNNQLWINDMPLTQEAVPDAAPLHTPADNIGRTVMEINGAARYPINVPPEKNADMPRLIVPNGHCFVLGDNRGASKDSRTFGPVPLADIKGRIAYIYWPARNWSRFGKYPY